MFGLNIHLPLPANCEIERDFIVSDMAVNTTGNKNLDAISTGELSINAMKFSARNLKQNGIFVSKIFKFFEVLKLRIKRLANPEICFNKT